MLSVSFVGKQEVSHKTGLEEISRRFPRSRTSWELRLLLTITLHWPTWTKPAGAADAFACLGWAAC